MLTSPCGGHQAVKLIFCNLYVRYPLVIIRFRWLCCRAAQKNLRCFWRPGPTNKGDYVTKNFVGSHHQNKHHEYLTPQKHLDTLCVRLETTSEGILSQ